MNPNQDASAPNNDFNEAPMAPVQPPQPEMMQPQFQPQPQAPAAPVQPVIPVQHVAVPQSPVTSTPVLGFVSLGLAVAAIIAHPLITGFGTTAGAIWLLLIPLILGLASVVLGVMVMQKSEALKAIVLAGIVFGSIAAVMGFSQLTQSAILQQRTKAQMEKLKTDLKLPSADSSSSSSLTTPSTQSGSSNSTSTSSSDTMKEIQAARDRVNKQMEEARARAESLSR